jgi:2-oxo-3-(phosphooxy)propyl 3-oxoalkanoate synthase
MSAKPDLTFDRTVSRELAHRRAVGEVFVTDSARLSDDEFALALQIPRAHSLWGDRDVPWHDPFATAEAARQGAFVVVHRYLGVPVEVPFTMRTFEFSVADLHAYQDNRRSPLEGVLRYRISDRRGHGGRLGSMRVDGTLTVDATVAMRVGGDVAFMSRDDYLALRAFQRASKPVDTSTAPDVRPVDAVAVGRVDRRNVVVGEPVGKYYPLVVDRAHPSYFDHDYDHVPGPFCVEGLRQAAVLAAVESRALDTPVAAMSGCDVRFHDFGEFEGPLYVSAEIVDSASDGHVHVLVGLHQFGKELVSGRIDLARYP